MQHVSAHLLIFWIRNISSAKTAKGGQGGRGCRLGASPGGVGGWGRKAANGFERITNDGERITNGGERITNHLLQKRRPPGRAQGGDGIPFSQPGDP